MKRSPRKPQQGREEKPMNKRDSLKNPGLDKKKFSKIKQEFHDIDYIDKLSDKEKAWLNSFMEEELGARMNHSGKKLNRKKEDKRRCYRNNNSRNRDLYSLARVTDRLVLARNTSLEALMDNKQEQQDNFDYEDALVEYIDTKRLQDTDDSGGQSD